MEDKNLKEKVMKAGLGYTLGNFLVKGLSFFTVPVFINIMTTADYGDYVYWMSFESIFSILVGCTIHTSFKNARLEFEDKLDDYISAIVLLIITVAIGFTGVINLLKLSGVMFNNLDMLSLNESILYSTASAYIMCYNSYVGLYYEYNSYLKVTLANALGNVVLSVFFILFIFKNNTYQGRILGSVIPIILVAIYIVHVLYKNKTLKKDVILKYWKWGLKYSLPIVPHGLSQIVLSQFDRIMIRDIIGSEQTAIYGFAFTVFLVVSVITGSLTGVWDQWFYSKLKSRQISDIRKAATNFTIVFFCFVSCYMLVSPEVGIILARGRTEYYESIYSIIPIVCSGFFIFLYNFPACIEYYYAKTKQIALCTATAAVVNVVLNYLFIGRYGYISAAYTTLITYVLYFVLHYIISTRIHKEHIYDLKVFVACGVLIVAFIPLCFCLLNSMIIRWGIAILIFIGTIIYGQKAFNLFEMVKQFILRRNRQ